MALIDSFPGASGAVDSTELRKNLAGLIIRDTAGNPRAGIFPRTTAALVTSRADMKLDVAAFEGVSVRGGGPLFMANDGVDQSPLLPIPLANSQISVLYFKQNESVAPYADADNLPIFGVVTGTAAASPTKPSVAGIAGAVELATITVPSTATATNSAGVVITNTFQYTTLTGGILWVRTTVERTAFLAPTGTRAYRIDAGEIATKQFDGVWLADPGREAGGRVKRNAAAATFSAGVWSVIDNTTYFVVDQPASGFSAFSGVWTCPSGAVYDVEAGIQLDATVNAIFGIKKNDVTASGAGIIASMAMSGVASFTSATVRARVRLAAGDTLAYAAYVSASAAWNTSNPDGSFFGVRYVEPLR